MDCFHPLSCRDCDVKGKACGAHNVSTPGHNHCNGNEHYVGVSEWPDKTTHVQFGYLSAREANNLMRDKDNSPYYKRVISNEAMFVWADNHGRRFLLYTWKDARTKNIV